LDVFGTHHFAPCIGSAPFDGHSGYHVYLATSAYNDYSGAYGHDAEFIKAVGSGSNAFRDARRDREALGAPVRLCARSGSWRCRTAVWCDTLELANTCSRCSWKISQFHHV
jgi:hypothetical protein